MDEIKIRIIPNLNHTYTIDDPYVGLIFYTKDTDHYYRVTTVKEINALNTNGNKVIEYIIDTYTDFNSENSGSGIVLLTNAEYNNLTTKDPNVLYGITDAEINMLPGFSSLDANKVLAVKDDGNTIEWVSISTSSNDNTDLTLYQTKQDDTLQTTAKSIVPAINELKNLLQNIGLRLSTLEADADIVYSAIVPSVSTINVNEGSNTSFNVTLSQAPNSTQYVSLSVSGDAASNVALSKDFLTFTNTNWNTPQTVTVSTTVNDDYANKVCTVTLSSNSTINAAVTINVINVDNTTTVVDNKLDYSDNYITLSSGLLSNKISGGYNYYSTSNIAYAYAKVALNTLEATTSYICIYDAIITSGRCTAAVFKNDTDFGSVSETLFPNTYNGTRVAMFKTDASALDMYSIRMYLTSSASMPNVDVTNLRVYKTNDYMCSIFKALNNGAFIPNKFEYTGEVTTYIDNTAIYLFNNNIAGYQNIAYTIDNVNSGNYRISYDLEIIKEAQHYVLVNDNLLGSIKLATGTYLVDEAFVHSGGSLKVIFAVTQAGGISNSKIKISNIRLTEI